MVYLDYNATTPLCPEAAEAMRAVLEGGALFGNPSSIHSAGRAARAAVDDARDRLAALLGAKAHELVFTGGGTEADNLAVLGLARQRVREGGARRHLVVSAVEHHAVLHAAEHLEAREGFELTRLPVDAMGLVDPEALRAVLTPQTALVSILSANNETGVVQPLAALAAVCAEAGVPFHSDCIQSFGKEPVRVDAGPGAISLAAHKFYGPKGVGLLWLEAGTPVERVFHGGAHENERRPGTENVAAIVGMAAAAEAVLLGMEAEQARQAALRDRLWAGISSAFPAAVRNGAGAPVLANTLNVSFPGVDGESLIMNLDLEGICVSSGSACMVGSIQPSHVLLAMGIPPEVAQATVRFSLGKGTTGDEVETVVARLPGIAERLLTP